MSAGPDFHRHRGERGIGVLAVLALIVVLVNFTVDLLYIYLNPQIRVR